MRLTVRFLLVNDALRRKRAATSSNAAAVIQRLREQCATIQLRLQARPKSTGAVVVCIRGGAVASPSEPVTQLDGYAGRDLPIGRCARKPRRNGNVEYDFAADVVIEPGKRLRLSRGAMLHNA